MKPLTERQRSVLLFLESCLSDRGYMPTIREIAQHFSVTSNAAVTRLEALERKGYLTREPGVARGIRLLRKVEAA